MSKYADKLSQLWRMHRAGRSPDAPTLISTFAGCGGSSLGYSAAGFRELLAVEWDQYPADMFARNFPDVAVHRGDIAKLEVDECLRLAGLGAGELDVFDGSPPCQGFSIAGKRMIDDPRNRLFIEFVRLIRGIKPKVFVMENVAGMVKGKHKMVFVEIIGELKASGYRVSARVLSAMHYGVPQSRDRIIFIGVRGDLGVEPSHPVGSPVVVTMKEALEGCVPSEITMLQGKNLKRVMGIPPRSTTKQRRMASMAAYGNVNGYTMNRLSWDRPSSTILKSFQSKSSFGTGLVMPDENRYVSISELKRLGSFPDEFELEGKIEQRWAVIGNSVPPLFMFRIAEHIRSSILDAIAGRKPMEAAC